MGDLSIVWKKSAIGYARDQKLTIRALGLRRLQHRVVHPDSPTLRGMIHKVRHLISVEEVGERDPLPGRSGEES